MPPELMGTCPDELDVIAPEHELVALVDVASARLDLEAIVYLEDALVIGVF